MSSAWWFILVGALVTYAWRGAGVALSGRIDPNSALMRWTSCVAYALLAGLIARLIVSPQGAVAATALWMRLSAAGVAVIVYLLCRRSIPFGVAAGAGWLMLMSALVP
ncbi:AzlD domain-containing protein [Dongia rigui]|uniref:AzlD domain-containing protein n=1 Tax=Dongia rigui TaxID=940149 RepID=A0ABU5DXF7_9PROT|nr:AzlD domain-containing protein [Dongia rigui]MDY0871975.1 AzlD domain-containing protein [Dongia rigui]